MEDSESIPTSGSIDKSRVLNIKPLRTLVPIFPSSSGAPGISSPQAPPFVSVPPNGPFPPGVAPFYPFFVPNDSQRPADPSPVANHGGPFGLNNPVHSPVPLNSFRTPTHETGAANGNRGTSRRSRMAANVADDGYSDSQDQSDQFLSGFSMHVTDAEDTSGAGTRKGKSQRKTRSGQQVKSPVYDVDIDTVVDNFMSSFNLLDFDMLKQADDNSGLVGYVSLIFDLLRRKLSQIEDAKEATPGATRRPDLRAGAIFMKRGIRTNANKRVGAVPGIEVGDIFFFRMELCLVGLHAPSMAGIDYMSVKLTGDEEPIAVSIVSSAGYEDDGDDGDVLIYSGQGGIFRKSEQISDQKLERGNLALEKSLHRGNEVRVIRGMKDMVNPTGKVYTYDGLYKIQESWVEKGKSGGSVFKYKLGRLPGQPAVFTLWKSIQHWKEGLTSRTGVILPDLTSGAESQPVCLVNDVDDEKGPAYFTYFPNLRYLKPFDLPKPSLSCMCSGGCHSGDPNCPCIQRNGGYSPYTALGILLSYQSLVHECGSSCSCPPTCRNRMSQAGLKFRLEVFKTKDKGWGLRSWDPIRAGSFIFEYAGEVIDISKAQELASENEDSYIFDTTRTYQPLVGMPADINGSPKTPYPLAISAKNGGNVARFMNHSCSPNVFWQPVLRENISECYLHIAFFAIRHIPPMQELTYDYGIVQNDRAGQMRKKCLCGSSKCRGYFY